MKFFGYWIMLGVIYFVFMLIWGGFGLLFEFVTGVGIFADFSYCGGNILLRWCDYGTLFKDSVRIPFFISLFLSIFF